MSTFVENRKRIGNWILLAGIAFLLIANWNLFSWYEFFSAYNSMIAAIILLLVFICYLDFNIKNIIRDKLLIFTVIINFLAVIMVFVAGRGKYVYFDVFDLTVSLYLSTRISLKGGKRDLPIKITALFFAFFFFYWTIDVKGYFKGYSVNYGGLVLLSGFVFVILLLEYIKYNKKVKYPIWLFIVEAAVAVVGYKIMAWYTSRTAFFAMVVFLLLILLPQKFISNKIVYPIITVGSVIGGIIFPVLYVWLGNMANRVDINRYSFFYKPLFSKRYLMWPQLYETFKNFAIAGIGGMYMKDSPIYRDGILDTCNSFVDLFVVHGTVVAVLVMALLIWVLLRYRKNVETNHFAKISYGIVITFIVASYAESYITTAPFVLIFMVTCAMTNSYAGRAYIVETSAEKASISDTYAKETSAEEAHAGNVVDTIDAIKDLPFKSYTVSFKKDKFLQVLAATFLVTFMVCIFGPIEIFYANQSEFMFSLSEFIWISVSVSIIGSLTIALALSFMPAVVSNVFSSLVFGVGIAAYIQYMFFNGNLINEFGEFVSTSEIGIRYYISIIVCFAIIIFSVVYFMLNKKHAKFIVYISAALVAIQCIAMVSVLIPIINEQGDKYYIKTLDIESQFEISPKDNTIVIILDSFGRNIFEKTVEQFPGRDEFLHDFTYYSNADSVYFPTFPSLVHFLTEEEFQPGTSEKQYTKTAFTTERAINYFNTLHSKDYDVRLYTYSIIVDDYLNGLIDNVTAIPKPIDENSTKRILSLMSKQSMYRYMPYNFKHYFSWDPEDVQNIYPREDYDKLFPYYQNYAAYDKLCADGIKLSDSDRNEFSLYHFCGSHAFPQNDENAKQVKITVSLYQEGAGALKMVDKFLDELKGLGKYDDSNIIVMADHGFFGSETQPIFFIKRKGEKHDNVVIDERDFSYHEFMNLIIDLAE